MIMAAAVMSTTSAEGAATVNASASDNSGERVKELPNVEVNAAAKSDVTLLPLNVTTVTEEEIDRSAETSLLPVIQSQVPGVFVSQRGLLGYGVSTGSAGSMSIRGVGQGNKVLFMIDGMPQWAGLFGHSLPDTYTANGVAKVEVVKGPSSLLYGSGAMGGSVNIITHKRLAEGWTGRARAGFGSYNTQKFNLATGLRQGRWEADVAGQLQRTDGYRERSAFWEANELMQLRYRPDNHWTVGAITQMTQSRAENPGTVQSPLWDMWTYIFRGSGAVYANDNYGIAHGGVQAFISWGGHKVDDGYNKDKGEQPTDYLFRSTDYNMGFNIYQTMHFWDGNDLSAGIDFTHWGGHAWNVMKADGKISEIKKECENEVGAYLMMQQSFWDGLLDLNAGVRLQHGSSYGNEWVPQAGFILRPYRGGSLKFAFSKGFRAPNIRELYMYKPANPDLKPESMLNYEVELRQLLLDNRLNLGLSLFFIDGSNMIQTEMIEGKPKNMNTGSFINKGIEFDASYRIYSDLGIGASYAYLHTNSKVLLNAPRHMVNAHADYTHGGIEVTIENQNIWGLQNGAPAGKRVNYSLLNLRGGYTFHAKVDIQPYLKIDNLTNNHYEIVYGCPMPGITLLGGVEIKF